MPNLLSSFVATADIASSLQMRWLFRSLRPQVTPLRRIVDGHRLRQAHRAQTMAQEAGLGGPSDGL